MQVDLKSALQDMVVVTAVRRALLRKEMYEMFEIREKLQQRFAMQRWLKMRQSNRLEECVTMI